jgi:hypothetical protein
MMDQPDSYNIHNSRAQIKECDAALSYTNRHLKTDIYTVFFYYFIFENEED